MRPKRIGFLLVVAFAIGVIFISCSNNGGDSSEKTSAGKSTEGSRGTTLEQPSVNEDFSFGVYFDKEGTTRTLSLKEGQDEFKCFIIVKYPKEMGIKAVQFKLVLPEGIEMVGDYYYNERTLSLGNLNKGISEGFPCVMGPSLLIHTLELKAASQVKDAVISLIPTKMDGFMGVVTCEDGNPMVRAASYVGVVNPAE